VPTLYLDPAAPDQVEQLLADLIEQGLVVERGRLTLHRSSSTFLSK
jgi:hypothetical protein